MVFFGLYRKGCLLSRRLRVYAVAWWVKRQNRLAEEAANLLPRAEQSSKSESETNASEALASEL